ncbi:type IV pilus biogenesis protein PilP [Pseudomonas phytophila]|uniref:Type IV pilus biogenesis protein PilP n=1 Tax=Pseudomonas phytophila TaxID=2867264 RepID=A0ABY6FMA8_9PSED|nr:type IV pilus biogenesis protein PilP [Pseudomonas phytophila]UXZ99087.1 type IV pilus biogenesis protein PilP [Pseudomonas phytophila]
MCINTQPRFLLNLLLIWIAASGVAVAAEQSTPDLSRINIGELSQVQSETLLFAAQAARARAQEDIVNGAKTPPSNIGQLRQSNLSPPAQASTAQTVLPVVKTVFRANNALHATLLYATGFEVDASMASADLPGGYKVISITLDSVVLGHNGRRFPLGFSTRPPIAQFDAPQVSSQALAPMTSGEPSPITQLLDQAQELPR